MDAFFDRFLKRPPAAGEKETLLNSFAQSCARDYPLQPVTAGAPALLNTLTRLRHPCYIASGSEQSELRTVLREIGLAEAFRDILGSPRKKSELVQEILAREPDIPRNQALFIGDARADFEAADANGIDFLQVEAYASDPEGMAKLRRDRGFRRVVSLADIVLSPLSAGIK
jgi:phosphoglycolate phosphatase-like HAD superfamily hydrolase